MNKNKKKILTVALIVCLVAVISFGTLAYFTDTDKTTNVFTIGSIDIEQNEKGADGNDFVQNQQLLPVADPSNPTTDDNYIAKIVTVSNKGQNSAFVRTHIAVPTNLVNYIHLHTDETNWTREGTSNTTMVGTDSYTVYTYHYNSTLASGTDTDKLLLGVYMDAKVDVKDDPDTPAEDLQFCMWNDTTQKYDFSGYPVSASAQINVLVATQAVQSQGFNGNIVSGLDAAFGAGASGLPDFNN